MFHIPNFLLFIHIFLVIASVHAQSNSLDKLNKQLENAIGDSARAAAYYQVASTNYRSTPQESLNMLTKGLELADKNKFEALEIDILNLQGVILLKLNQFDESIKTHYKVLKKREEKNDKKGIMLSFLNIGNVFNKSYDPKQALKYYHLALNLSKEIHDVKNQANISTNIGNIYAQNALKGGNQKDVSKAIQFLLNTVNFCNKNAPEVPLFNTYILLSYLYLKADNLERSTYYTDIAIKITNEKKDPVGESYARVNRANIFIQQKRFDLAEKEVALIKKIIANSGIDGLLEDFGSDFDKIAKAIETKNQALILSDQDSLDKKFHEDAESMRVRVREELREKYESEKKELENKNLLLKSIVAERESQLMKYMWLVTLLVLVLFLVMLVILLKKNRQIRQEKRKVEEQALAIKQQHIELVQADRFRSTIFSVVSHDLRSPIATFQALLSISKLVDLPPHEIKNMLLSIGNQVNVASKMLDSLLVWSSEQMANEELHIQDIHPKQIIDECKELFMDRIQIKKLHIVVDIPEQMIIRSDLKRFEFIIRNIFNNAIKFSFSGKSIIIDQNQTKEEVVISITDQGVGMDEQTIRSLKRKDLQKSLEGTLDEKGTGIGLMLCHEFANRIGCNIIVSSRIGFGSTFSIVIPK